MEIKQFEKEAHENAVKHGWWDKEPSFGELIALCHSELSEALKEYRDGHKPDQTYYSCTQNANIAGECDGNCGHCQYGKMEGIPSELADVIIRVLDMAEHYNINLETALTEKQAFNETRPYKHDGKVI